MIVSGMGQLVCDFQAASILRVRTDSFSYQNDRVHPEPLKYGNPDCQASEAFAKYIAARDAEPCDVPDLSLGRQDPKNLPTGFLFQSPD